MSRSSQRRRAVEFSWRGGWVLGAQVLLAAALVAPALGQPSVRQHVWRGLDGEPLPFDSSGQIEEFLRTAEIVDLTRIPIGASQPRVAVLEQDGVRARAAFHDHHVVNEGQRMVGGSVIAYFRDSYTNQVAAWEVAQLLELTNTPPSVIREVDGVQGSLQLWVENAMMESEREVEGLVFPDRLRAWRQVYDMDVFDALINNLDRTQRNFLWQKETWDLWMIDHTRAFGADRQVLRPAKVRKCSRRLLRSLRRLDARQVKRALEPYMSKQERSAVVSRRKHLVKLIEARIAERGESEVLFDH